MPQYVCSDEDFHTAMLMTDVLLEHSLLLSTSVQKSETNSKPLKPYFRLRPDYNLFRNFYLRRDGGKGGENGNSPVHCQEAF